MAHQEPGQIAWDLYRNAFTDGEHVVVVDDFDDFYWGRLKSTDGGVCLTRPDGQSDELRWGDIAFMAHDGFPVKRIMGMSETEAARIAEATPTEKIRQCMKDWSAIKDPAPRYIFSGDPFVHGPFQVVGIHNAGNSGPAFWDNPEEEVLVLRARDGAVLHSYDMDSMFAAR